jgi:hypothetical protein
MSTPASILSGFWHNLVQHDRQALSGSVVSESGVHLHHLVWGICLMLATRRFAPERRTDRLKGAERVAASETERS